MSIKLAKLSKIIARKRPQKIGNLSRGEKMKLGNNLFQARKKSGLSHLLSPKNWESVDKPYPNGKQMKLSRIFINQKSSLHYIL